MKGVGCRVRSAGCRVQVVGCRGVSFKVYGAGYILLGVSFRRIWIQEWSYGAGCRVPHGGVRPFHPKSTCLTQLNLGPDVVQIWSRDPQISEGLVTKLAPHKVLKLIA